VGIGVVLSHVGEDCRSARSWASLSSCAAASLRAKISAAVRDALADEINSGQLGPGDRVPSEAELCERFGVARMTARRAVRELRERGLVYTEWGKGTFVNEHQDEPGR
jgi:GntR family transcriptional regulator